MTKHKPIPLGPRISIWPPVVLAPMAGVTSYPYRKICRDFGAGLCVSEMISSRGILENHDKTWSLAQFGADERPRSIQIFGSDPGAMGEATLRLRGELDVDHIDINFGCPVPKIVRKGMGAAAVLDSVNFQNVLRAVVRAAEPAPVTIKVRLGMDEALITFREAGRIAQEEGCAYVALHARTARQMYSGKARWEFVRELKEALRIPVLGNGDIFQAEDALRRMEETGCDGVVIGRGCLGNPWLFRDLLHKFEGAGVPRRPGIDDLVDVLRVHFRLLLEHFHQSPRWACVMMRKFGAWYVHGLRGAASLRRDFQAIEGEEDFNRVLDRIRGENRGDRDGEPELREVVTP
jgi:nifR3 family TIM-barrel protein